MSEMLRKATHVLIKHYLEGGRIPWSPGYLLYRERLISQTLADPDLMRRFRMRDSLPAAYGYAVDERCVEYPWLLAQIEVHPERVLDAGAALNHKYLLDQPLWQGTRLHVMTLGPEEGWQWQQSVSYLFEDLRQIPIRNGYYDMVVCLSTLEHIGMDNSVFHLAAQRAENKPDDYLLAVREMRRVLQPSGRLLFSVPFGRYRNVGAQQVFDEDLLERTIAGFGPARAARTFFTHTREGWQFASAEDCKECEYVDWSIRSRDLRPAEFPVQADGAAAARAVACVRLEAEP